MLLENRVAVVYGGGGPIGSAIARGFAREGATTVVAGRGLQRVEAVAEHIRSAGGVAEAMAVDALSEDEVDGLVADIAARHGSLDISCNVIGVADVQGTAMIDMTLADFLAPVVTAVTTQFLTMRAAGRQMARQGRGVILTFGGGGARNPIRDYSIGGFITALAAVDAMRRQLAAELGRAGVRVLTLESGGIGDSLPEDYPNREALVDSLVAPTMLKRLASYEDVGNVAAFAASDYAAAITGTNLNISCGASVD